MPFVAERLVCHIQERQRVDDPGMLGARSAVLALTSCFDNMGKLDKICSPAASQIIAKWHLVYAWQ